MQSDASSLPVTPTNLPMRQSMQSLRALPPTASRYVPASQLMHHAAPVAGAYIPMLQATQSEAASLPVVSRYLPTAHKMQSVSASLPVVSKYLPTPHRSHALAPGFGPLSVIEPAGQLLQAVALDVESEKVPSGEKNRHSPAAYERSGGKVEPAWHAEQAPRVYRKTGQFEFTMTYPESHQ